MIWNWLWIALFLGYGITCPLAAQPTKPWIQAQPELLLNNRTHYQKIAETNTWAHFPLTICLKPWSTDSYVALLRNNLLLTGDLSQPTDSATTYFGPDLVAAVRRFQQRHGLTADGVVGAHTLMALNVPPAERIKQIEVNISRWQALAETTFPLILVNIPDYMLYLFLPNGQVIWQTNVIVGLSGKAYQTVPLASKISYLVLQPSWNVPKSIIQREILPLLKTDPHYLNRNHMTLYQQDNKGNKLPLNPSTLNASTLDANKLTVIQSPGPGNALGKIKFIFANPYDIYLHDTPAKNLFSHPVRAYSHGCVRVQNPERLATYLLSPDWQNPVPANVLRQNTPDKIMYLPKPVPIQLGYFTAWVAADGTLQFRNDIYQRDNLISFNL